MPNFPTRVSVKVDEGQLLEYSFINSVLHCRSKGRVPKHNPYFLWSFAKPGGGGSARVEKKPYCFFEEKEKKFREHEESF